MAGRVVLKNMSIVLIPRSKVTLVYTMIHISMSYHLLNEINSVTHPHPYSKRCEYKKDRLA